MAETTPTQDSGLSRSRRWGIVLVILALAAGGLLADPFNVLSDDDDDLSEASRELLDELAKQGDWDLVAAGLVGAEWYLYNRPGSIGQSGGDPEAGVEALAEKAGTKGLINGSYDYIESQTGRAPPSSFDAALAAKVLQVQYQRTIINTHLAYHQNEFPPHEREFWDWYQGEYLPGYHDLYGDPGSGASHGDPHVATHDELRIRFQSVGEFILVRSAIDDFELQARHQPFFSSTSVSVNAAIAVQLEGERLVVDAYDSIPVRLNGEPLEMDTDVRQISDGVSVYRDDPRTYLFSTRSGVLVTLHYWRGTSISIDVGLPTTYRGNVEGVFGDYDGDPSNDLRLRDGTVLPPEHASRDRVASDPLYEEFADAWRISQQESLFDYPEGETTQDYTDRSFPQRPVNLGDYSDERREWAERTCREAGVRDGRLLDDCIYDLLVTEDQRFARGAAALSELASGRSEGEMAGAFTPLDRCLALPCDQVDDDACSGLAGVVCDIRWPDEPDEERLCVTPGAQCDRDDQCCGFSGCVDGTCAPRAEGQACVTTRECAGGLLCSFDEPRQCYDPGGG